VLQEGEVKPVGATESRKVDVRVIAATRVDLERAMAEGRFREDLFYRLNVINAHLPPLRERPEDVPLLAQHFLKESSLRLGKRVDGITRDALSLLTTARWPGNVRELRNVIERAVIMCAGPTVDVDNLPLTLRRGQRVSADVDVLALAHLPYGEAKQLAIRAFERRYLTALLEKHGGKIASAARAAHLDRSNLRRLLKQFGVEVQRPAEQPRPLQ
jgi:two-component system response regulator HydG